MNFDGGGGGGVGGRGGGGVGRPPCLSWKCYIFPITLNTTLPPEGFLLIPLHTLFVVDTILQLRNTSLASLITTKCF